MLPAFYQPKLDGVVSRTFSRKAPAERFCKRHVRNGTTKAELYRFRSPAEPGELVATFTKSEPPCASRN